MIKREIEHELKSLCNDYPVVTVVGPRQAGKTTIVQKVFPKKAYCSLEDPDIRVFAQTDPRSFLNEYPKGVILDEIQRAPVLLSYIQTIVDKQKKPGMFILTGSHQTELHDSINQSLAGRTAILTLYPLNISELKKEKIHYDLFKYIFTGFFPAIYSKQLNPTRFYKNYYQTYVERDVRRLINLKDLSSFQTFMKLLAGRVGQVVNYSNLSNDVGISAVTVKQWISVLEASYILFRLPPYFENFCKRVIKSPKIYFTDVGLVSYLLGIEKIDQVHRDPLRGNLFENMVILELLKMRVNQGLEPNLYFFRDTHGNEIDCLYKTGGRIVPIEIKSSGTFNFNFMNGLNKFKAMAGDKMDEGYLIYAGEREQKIKFVNIINFHNVKKLP